MTVTIFLILLTGCSAITSLLTEGVKKFLDSINVKYIPNILVLIIAMISGCGATAIYYINNRVAFDAINSIYLVLMGVANWLGAMLGYDKVKQAIMQIKSNKEE